MQLVHYCPCCLQVLWDYHHRDCPLRSDDNPFVTEYHTRIDTADESSGD